MFANRHKSSDNHGSDNRVANQIEPGAVEVLQTASHQAKGILALIRAGMHEQQQDCSIDELQIKDDLCCLYQPDCFLWVVKYFDKSQAHLTQNDVESDDETFKKF